MLMRTVIPGPPELFAARSGNPNLIISAPLIYLSGAFLCTVILSGKNNLLPQPFAVQFRQFILQFIHAAI